MLIKKGAVLSYMLLAPLFIIALMYIINLWSPRFYATEGMLNIDGDSACESLKILDGEWNREGMGDTVVYTIHLVISGGHDMCLFLPETKALSVNGNIIPVGKNTNHIIYELDQFSDKTNEYYVSIENNIDYDFDQTLRCLYFGSSAKATSYALFLNGIRLIVMGIAIAILFQSVSLYSPKKSEKYLLLLLLLDYLILARVIRMLFPGISEIEPLNCLLFGQYYPEEANSYVRLIFRCLRQGLKALIITIIHYYIYHQFVRTKYWKIELFAIPIIIDIVMVLLGFFNITSMQFDILDQALICSIYVAGGIAILIDDTALLSTKYILASGIVLALSCVLMVDFCVYGIFPNGFMNQIVDLITLEVSSNAIFFMVAINGKFSRKFSEADRLAVKLEDNNVCLEKAVQEKTKELQSSYITLKELQTRKDQFVSNMVHNLKTPLFSLSGYVNMVKAEVESDSEKAQSHLDIIGTTADNTLKLIDAMMLYDRLEDKTISLECAYINLSKLLETIISLFIPQTTAKNVKVTLTCGHTNSVYCDAFYMRQAVTNILENGIRHVGKGGHISFETEDANDGVHIMITNDGPPISDEYIDLIFERYYSVRNDVSTVSGLGLPIARGIIQQHGGELFADRGLSNGAVFHIILP